MDFGHGALLEGCRHCTGRPGGPPRGAATGTDGGEVAAVDAHGLDRRASDIRPDTRVTIL